MKGYIYIMTNPALRDMVKIGFASDVERRRKELSTTALPYEYEVYATYETSGNLEDKNLHKMIDNLNPDLRVSQNREFFIMSPEDAYELLKSIAIISGTPEKLKRTNDKTAAIKRPAIDFYKCGFKDGDKFACTEAEIEVEVCGNRKVLYEGEITSLSAIMSKVKGIKAIQGPLYFTYNGETLTDIAERTQWK